jgi:hypothetical protein
MSIMDLFFGGWLKICQQQYDEKNIRRRVYDALNVLMAMDIISKDKKEIQWKGLPRTSQNDIEELKVCSQSWAVTFLSVWLMLYVQWCSELIQKYNKGLF